MPRRLPLFVSVAVFAAALSLASCKENPAPDQPTSPSSPVGATELRDTIQKPIDKAKGVEAIIQKSHDKQDQQMQSQEGDSAASPP
jgi:hypothetical protein